MKQYCNQCFKLIDLPEGGAAVCPSCGKPMAEAVTYKPSVAEAGGVPVLPTTTAAATTGMPNGAAAKPLGGVAAATASPPPMPSVASTAAVPPGLNANAFGIPATSAAESHGSFGFTLSPTWLQWVPPGCIVAAFVLTFFAWDEMTLGGYTVMTQTGWNSFAGNINANSLPAGTEWTNLEADLLGRTDEKKAAMLRSDGLVIPYILVLLLTLIVVFAERFVTLPEASKLPKNLTFLPKVWGYLPYLLLGLCTLLFVLLWFQTLRGFGLEHSIEGLAKLNHQAALDANPTDSKKKELWIQIGQEMGKYPVTTTGWVKLAVLLHFVAVLAIIALIWLKARAAKPMPRLGVSW